MKKNYFLIAGMALLATPLASAYDASDFVGKICGQVWMTNPAADWTGTDCNYGMFEAYPGDNSKVILTMLDRYTPRGGDQFVFQISGNTLTLVGAATEGLMAYDATGKNADIFTTDYQKKKTFGWTTYSDYMYNFYGPVSNGWTGTISDDTDREVIKVDFNGGTIGLARMAYYDDADLLNISNRTLFYIYSPNGTQTVKTTTGNTVSYPVRVRIKSEQSTQKVFSLENFLGKGWVAKHAENEYPVVVEQEKSGVVGWLYTDNSIKIPDQKIAPKMTATVKSLTYGGGYWLRGNTIDVGDLLVRRTASGGDITGSYTPLSDTYTINSSNFWHKDHDGDLEMYEDGRLTINNFVQFRDYDGTSLDRTLGSYTGSTIDFSMPVAPKVTVKLDAFGADNTYGVYAKGTLTEPINDKYVNDYELYLVPGTFSKISESGFETHLEHGHSDALCLSKYTYSRGDMAWSGHSTVTKDNMKFEVRVPVEDIVAKGWDKNNQNYTIFVRYNLTPAGMARAAAPNVFGAMVTPKITTGVEDLVAPSAEAEITAGAGCINIVADTAASVYNASGVMMYHGTDSSVSVAPGLYIVKAGNKVAKVVVR